MEGQAKNWAGRTMAKIPWPPSWCGRTLCHHCQTVNTTTSTTNIGQETLLVARWPQEQFLIQSCFSTLLAPSQRQAETSSWVPSPSTIGKEDLERSLTCAMRGGLYLLPQFSEKSLEQILGRSKTKHSGAHSQSMTVVSTTSLSP